MNNYLIQALTIDICSLNHRLINNKTFRGKITNNNPTLYCLFSDTRSVFHHSRLYNRNNIIRKKIYKQ